MWRYLELLSFERLATINKWKHEVEDGRNPREIKVALAQEIVARFHGAQAAQTALADFETRFQRGGMPEDMPEAKLKADGDGLALVQVLKQAGLTASTSEALRMIEQGGVRLDGARMSDKALRVARGSTVVVQIGKRKFARVTIT
jgi:tyrosyl-tRNA synthetase